MHRLPSPATKRPVSVRIESLTLSFLHARHLIEVLLSFRWIFWLCEAFGLFKKSRERAVVLNDINIEIHQGTVHGLFGVNGSGKSTLINCIAYLLVPQQGRILVHGRAIDKDRDFARGVVAKCNRRELYAEFTAMGNIEFVARLYGLDIEDAKREAQRLLDRLGVSRADQEEKVVHRLSMGTAGKVALVRTLLPLLAVHAEGGEGPVLLLDEPTYGFDVGSVEQFYRALRALMAAVPTLTVIIATNDPRDAGFCDNYTALVGNRAVEDPARLEHLKRAMGHAREGLLEFAEMIGQDISDASQSGPPEELPKVKRSASASAIRAFWWRDLTDLVNNPWTSVLVVTVFVIPNLIGMLAAAAGPGPGVWQALVMTGLGIYATLLTREALRVIDRERGYYNMLELVIGSPVSNMKHFLSAMSCGLAIKIVQTVVTMLCLIGLLWFSINNDAAKSWNAATVESVTGMVVTAAVVTVFLVSLGLAASVVPFTMRGDNAFFFLSLVPTMLVLLGGVYYRHSSLPVGVSQVVQFNPITYAAEAIRCFSAFPPADSLPAADWVMSLLPGVMYPWACVLLFTSMTLATLVVSTLVFYYGKSHLHRIGRLRNAS